MLKFNYQVNQLGIPKRIIKDIINLAEEIGVCKNKIYIDILFLNESIRLYFQEDNKLNVNMLIASKNENLSKYVEKNNLNSINNLFSNWDKLKCFIENEYKYNITKNEYVEECWYWYNLSINLKEWDIINFYNMISEILYFNKGIAELLV